MSFLDFARPSFVQPTGRRAFVRTATLSSLAIAMLAGRDSLAKQRSDSRCEPRRRVVDWS